MRIPYDRTSHDPPAPVFDVSLFAPGDAEMGIAASALLDTGADVSAIPAGFGDRLGLPVVDRIRVAGVSGEPETSFLWLIDVETPAGRFQVRAVDIGSELILGRDVLNQVSLLYDGPHLELEWSAA